jgi:hypothetical protein
MTNHDPFQTISVSRLSRVPQPEKRYSLIPISASFYFTGAFTHDAR